MVLFPLVADVVLEEQEPPKVTVPASEDVIIKSGVLSFVGVVTSQPEITGAVVSVEVELSSSVVVEVVEEPLSLLLAQEKMVKLKRDMRIMYKTLFIFFLHQ